MGSKRRFWTFLAGAAMVAAGGALAATGAGAVAGAMLIGMGGAIAGWTKTWPEDHADGRRRAPHRRRTDPPDEGGPTVELPKP
jgi:hypothetical protein